MNERKIMKWNCYLILVAFVLTAGCETANENKKTLENEVATESAASIEGKSHFEQLQDLAWMVGNWRDEDKNLDITFNMRWGHRNKNFLIQHFIVKVAGE